MMGVGRQPNKTNIFCLSYLTFFIQGNFTASFLAEILCHSSEDVKRPGLGLEVEDNDGNPSFHQSY